MPTVVDANLTRDAGDGLEILQSIDFESLTHHVDPLALVVADRRGTSVIL